MGDRQRQIFARLDEVVDVELRANSYPYGGGEPGVGVQITLEHRHRAHIIAARLPAEAALALADAIREAVAGA
jgi:hypothetical protein